MTRLEVIKAHKKAYESLKTRAQGMSGIEKAVAENITLEWISNNKWMGGLNDSKAQKLYEKVSGMGYTFDEIDAEFERQIMEEVEC